MTVYFVLRSHYDEPSGKRLRKFEDATVLDWFRRHWGSFHLDDLWGEVYDLLGYYVDPFVELAEAILEENLPVPETDEQLEEYLREHTDPESQGKLLFGPHLLTILTVDKVNMEMCSYLFDDTYLAAHPERAAFLLHEGWQLPGGHSETGGFEPTEPIGWTDEVKPGGDGATYGIFLAYNYASEEGPLRGLDGVYRIKGVRLPDLAAALAGGDSWEGLFLCLLRAHLFDAPFTDDPREEGFRQELLARADAATLAAYSDWLLERQDRPVGLLFLEQALNVLAPLPVAYLTDADWLDLDGPIGPVRQRLSAAIKTKSLDSDQVPLPKRCRIQVEEHVAQLCHNTEHWRSHHRAELYHQWIFFDDLWAAAHPVLANAILRYARCWDVLSPDGPHDRD
jgi:hypothetical protein